MVEEKDRVYKIVMLGDAGVGKTCIVNRYVKNQFSDTESTLGSNYSAKVLQLQPQGVIKPVKAKLQIWDTAGGEQFRSLAPIYYKGADAVCLVYDSTNQDTFESLNYWVEELTEKVEQEGVVLAVVASKTDYVEAEQVKAKRGKDFAIN